MTFYFWLLRRWQRKQFGESRNIDGVIKHLRKEILEAENTYNENEWCDIVLLACQGAWRSGWSPWSFTLALWSKLW